MNKNEYLKKLKLKCKEAKQNKDDNLIQLNKEKIESIICACDLQYPKAVLDKIMLAESINQISRIMVDARHNI